MAKKYPEISDKHAAFIAAQKMFFVGTATADSRINLSPKGLGSLRILNSKRVVWLNLTGSGNETAAHVQVDPRMTLMFCSFAGDPLILRLYGKAKVIHQRDPEWNSLYSLFDPIDSARQLFDVSVDLVMSSCGAGVPYYTFEGERETLREWASAKGPEGVKNYWEEKNQTSIDGIPTHICKG
jgi:hypothetical protein